MRIFAIRKNRKINSPKKFLPTHQALCQCTITNGVMFSLWNMHSHAVLICFDRFCLFFSSFSCLHELKKVTFDVSTRIVGVARAKPKLSSYRRARCTMWHVSRTQHRSNFSPETATFTKPIGNGFQNRAFGCSKSQNFTRLREIAKINTRKIVGILKSQNFVLANNSNNKVPHTVYMRILIRGQPASRPPSDVRVNGYMTGTVL